MTTKPRRKLTNSAEVSPHPRITAERKKSHQRTRNSSEAATASMSCDHQEPSPSDTPSRKSESAINRATQNA